MMLVSVKAVTEHSCDKTDNCRSHTQASHTCTHTYTYTQHLCESNGQMSPLSVPQMGSVMPQCPCPGFTGCLDTHELTKPNWAHCWQWVCVARVLMERRLCLVQHCVQIRALAVFLPFCCFLLRPLLHSLLTCNYTTIKISVLIPLTPHTHTHTHKVTFGVIYITSLCVCSVTYCELHKSCRGPTCLQSASLWRTLESGHSHRHTGETKATERAD